MLIIFVSMYIDIHTDIQRQTDIHTYIHNLIQFNIPFNIFIVNVRAQSFVDPVRFHRQDIEMGSCSPSSPSSDGSLEAQLLV